jgi:hypothetical protein
MISLQLTKGVYFMENAFKLASALLSNILDLGVKLIAVSVVLQILFGAAVPFMAIDVVAAIVKIVAALGAQGLTGLVAISVIYWAFNKK